VLLRLGARLAPRLLPPLSADVVGQSGRLRVLLVTGETSKHHVGLGIDMLRADVIVEQRRLSKAAAAHRADVQLRLFTVCTTMHRQQMGSLERLSALLALKTTSVAVTLQMDRKTAVAAELLIALVAGEPKSGIGLTHLVQVCA